MPILTSSASLRLLQMLACGLLLTGLIGCSSPGPLPAGTPANPVEFTSFWQPYLLFIQSTPHPRLYIEVDAVEGVIVDDESLRRLQSFLEAYCVKPAGIQIVRDTVIAREHARGISPEALAGKYLAGPPPGSNAPPAAFIYILLFDTTLARDPGTCEGSTAAAAPSMRRRDPCALLLPYPAVILIDPSVAGPANVPKVAQLAGTFLQHEAGHLLGIARDPAHAAGLHCRDQSCLMYPLFTPVDLLLRELWKDELGPSPVPRLRLCTNCDAEARGHVRAPGPANLRFVGPVLVRWEDGYQVLALPHRLKLVVGHFEEPDAWEFVHAVQNEPLNPLADDSSIQCTGVVKPDARKDRIRLRETLQRARQDPYVVVQQVAARL